MPFSIDGVARRDSLVATTREADWDNQFTHAITVTQLMIKIAELDEAEKLFAARYGSIGLVTTAKRYWQAWTI
jgi:hypothetical protein